MWPISAVIYRKVVKKTVMATESVSKTISVIVTMASPQKIVLRNLIYKTKLFRTKN